jgi:catechol 2,3-dioxygenase-like lactoylglutathione lyase family enzyme
MLAAAADSGLSARIRPVALTPFHVALQVRDLAEARRFYGDTLGCSEGRTAPDWVDFNMYGHQFVCHRNPQLGPAGRIGAHFNASRASSPRSSFWILRATRSSSSPSQTSRSCSRADPLRRS